ncbi:MAG: putative peptidoglycan glycosyltransferase FtsW [Anaerolineae bacterium]
MAVESQQRIQLFAPSRGRENELARPDYMLLLIVGAMIVIGLLSIYSVSFGPKLSSGDDPWGLVERHGLFLIIGLAVMFVTMRLDYHLLQRLAVPLMLVTLALLGLVLLFGQETEGARRWFFGGSIQPSEFAKITTIIYIATWVTSKGTKLRQVIYGLVPFSILVGLVAGLIAAEPNFSTAILIAATAFAVFFIAGADAIQFGLSMLIGTVTAFIFILKSPYALSRISLVWTDVFKVPSDQVWQLEQSLLALASGGILGKGLSTGGGQYGYVPLAHSDGIFAIWGEETGLIGTWLLVALILALTYRGFRVASKAPDDFGRVLAAGITFWLTFQAFVNIGVVTQLLPLTGQPLPFISYGGSSLIIALLGVGLLLSVSRGKPSPVVVKSTPKLSSTPRAPAEKEKNATVDDGWRNRRPRVSAVGRSTKPRRRPRTRSLD